jgi:hypothetical protein
MRNSALILGLLMAVSMPGIARADGEQHPSNGDQHPGEQHPGDQHPGDQHPGDQHPGDQHPGDQHPSDGDQHPGQTCDKCKVPTRDVCFNLVCHYDFDEDVKISGDEDHIRHCTAASTFRKDVTLEGGEVADDSGREDDNNPTLEVSCNGRKIWGNSAHRYTDLLGTRIQGQTGPNPAITLPRGELHSGPDHRSGSHYSRSTLELDLGEKVVRAKGSCFIWTGAP